MSRPGMPRRPPAYLLPGAKAFLQVNRECLCAVPLTGPSAEVRAKGLLARRRSGGLVLAGRAAKLARTSQLLSRGLSQEEVEEQTAAVGLRAVREDHRGEGLLKREGRAWRSRCHVGFRVVSKTQVPTSVLV